MGLSETYADRLTAIFEAVHEESRPDGISVATLREILPFEASSHEIRAKLMELRRRGCVFYDPEMPGGPWYG